MSSDEAEVDRRKQVLVMPAEGKNLIAHVVLTTDRILYGRELFAHMGRGLLARLAEEKIQKMYDERSGGPAELVALEDIRGARRVRRKVRGDIYEFALADGSTCALGAKSAEGWDAEIRRLLSERHGKTVVDAEDGWRVD